VELLPSSSIIEFEAKNLRTLGSISPAGGIEIGLQLIQINLQADVQISILTPFSFPSERREIPITMPEI